MFLGFGYPATFFACALNFAQRFFVALAIAAPPVADSTRFFTTLISLLVESPRAFAAASAGIRNRKRRLRNGLRNKTLFSKGNTRLEQPCLDDRLCRDLRKVPLDRPQSTPRTGPPPDRSFLIGHRRYSKTRAISRDQDRRCTPRGPFVGPNL
jgi:hypothetical protein